MSYIIKETKTKLKTKIKKMVEYSMIIYLFKKVKYFFNLKDFKNNLVQNFQNFTILNKNYYENKKKEGFGIQIWKDGAKFVGYFIDNKAYGNGRFSHIEGDDYSGKLNLLII